MYDVITIGDAMITFDPASTGPLRFVDTFKRKVGGAELNFAIGCSRLGLRAGWISRLGHDEFGRYIYNFARGEGVDVSEVFLERGYSTSLNFKEIGTEGDGKTFYYRENSPTLELTPQSLNEEYFKKAKYLHITGVFPAIQEQNRDVIREAISLAKKHNVFISMDPNIRLKLWSEEEARSHLLEWVSEVDVLLAGDEELKLLFNTTSMDEVLRRVDYYNVDQVFIKRGSNGASFYSKGNLIEQSALPHTKAIDTVGAGDGFNAGAIYGLLAGWQPYEILEFANAIGSIVVSVKGDNDGLPYLEEVYSRLGKKTIVER